MFLTVSIKRGAHFLSFWGVRRLERWLSVRNLYRVLMPVAWARAALSTAFRSQRPGMPVPECLQVKWSGRLERRLRMNSYLSHMLDCFPDRLAEAKWQGCCRFVGLERLQEAKQNGRPVVLAFAHFGPYWLLLTWLRCAGFPVASLASGKAADHSRIRAWQARYLPFPEIPASFYQDELRETAGFLAAGHPLGLSVDNAHASGKQMEVPFCEGWNFRMATGLVRMAIRQKAVVIPCLMIDEGGWHYRIELGRPVPEEFLTTEAEWSQAGKYVLDEMMPHLLMQPELCKRDFVLCLQKNTDGNSGAVA